MSGLVEFLRARLDEDEALAREAPPGPWLIGNAVDPTQPCSVHTFPGVRLVADGLNWLVAEHIARQNPARTLADVAAKRSVLARHHAAPVPPGNEWAEEYPYCAAHGYKGPDGTVIYPVELEDCPELRDLAGPYGRHPDYREEWKP